EPQGRRGPGRRDRGGTRVARVGQGPRWPRELVAIEVLLARPALLHAHFCARRDRRRAPMPPPRQGGQFRELPPRLAPFLLLRRGRPPLLVGPARRGRQDAAAVRP